MQKIASNHEVTSAEAIKCATAGFATALGSPASTLNPPDVNKYASKFSKRASDRVARHETVRKLAEPFMVGAK